MGTRRSNREGSAPRRRKDGRWVVNFSWTDRDGKAHRHSVYGRTRKEVVDKAKAVSRRLEEGAPARDATVTLADYVETWIGGTLKASARKPTTKQNYATLARGHVAASPLGRLPLARVTPQRVEAWVADLGQRRAASTTRTAYTVLRAILGTAVRDGLLQSNPAAVVDRPHVPHEEARYLTPDELHALLAAAAGSRYLPMFRLLAATGLRRGEAVGLRWDDVDLDGRVLHVRRTLTRLGGELVTTEPKSARSRRPVGLFEPVCRTLREVRARQAEERLAAGSKWHPSDYVFTTGLGGPVEPRNVHRAIVAAARRAGLEGDVGCHTLRHTAAATMLTNGVPITVVSRVLGHQSIAVTVDLYGHVAPEVSQTAADVLGAALGL